jgi:DNA-binding CsgD family transcriptional regulator
MARILDPRAHADARDDARLLRFLNRLAPLDEPIGWLAGFRDVLAELLGDVDRVSVSVNAASFDADHQLAGLGVERIHPIVVARAAERDPASRIVEEARATGFPVDAYLAPVVFTYHAGEGTYVGAVLLWRLRDREPIGERSLALMHELRPFITYRLVECIARMVRTDRLERSFGALAAEIAGRAGLSEPQTEVFALAATGLSVGSIAARLGVTPRTVRRRIAAICRLTGATDVPDAIRRNGEPGA